MNARSAKAPDGCSEITNEVCTCRGTNAVVQKDINEQTVNRISNLEEKHLNDMRELRDDLGKIEKELDRKESRR